MGEEELTMKTSFYLLCSVIVPLLLGGCIMSKPKTEYILRADEKAPRQYSNVVIIDSVQLAGYLERSNPVRRIGRHKVDFYPTMAWAQDLRSMVKETLSHNLLLRNAHSHDAKFFRALVSFLRLEVDENSGKFVVSAVCAMRCGKESTKRHFIYSYDCSGCSGEKLIDLYDKALSDLADKMCEMAEDAGK